MECYSFSTLFEHMKASIREAAVRSIASRATGASIINDINTPRFTGKLHARWRIKRAVGGGVAYNIENAARYAAYQERGTRAHFVPKRYIRPWAVSHGIIGSRAPRGWRGMMVSGRPQRYAAHSAQPVGVSVARNFIDWFKFIFRMGESE